MTIPASGVSVTELAAAAVLALLLVTAAAAAVLRPIKPHQPSRQTVTMQ